MGDIYAKAQGVLVWLGPKSELDYKAFDTMSLLCSRFPDLTHGALRLENFDTHGGSASLEVNSRIFEALIKNPSPEIDATHIAHMLLRPWFERTWIIQEVARASWVRVVCGNSQMDWETLLVAFDIYVGIALYLFLPAALRKAISSAISNLTAIRKCRNEALEPLASLFERLCWTRNFKATDPRDKLYAILGLVPHPEFKITPDYHAHFRDIFKTFAITNMVDNRDLRLLSCTSGFAQFSEHELPSWIPDWSTSVDRNPTAAYSNSSFHAGGHLQPRISIRSTGDDVLVIHGKLISQVSAIATSRFSAGEDMNVSSEEDNLMEMLTKVIQWYKGQIEWLKEWHGLQLGGGASQALEFLDGPLERDFLRSLLCDGHVYEEFASIDFPERYKNIHRTCSDYVEMLTKISEGETEIGEQDREFLGVSTKLWGKFAAQLSFSAYGRSFCRTANGYVGYVPNETEPGDVVCLFYGATVLYVMRPDGDGTYRLVGECCMEGLMHGEALEATQFESQDFHIR